MTWVAELSHGLTIERLRIMEISRTITRAGLRIILLMATVATVGVVGIKWIANRNRPADATSLLQLGFALDYYAQIHDGHYPTGGGSPEASLHFLYRDGIADPEMLAGAIDPKLVREHLENGLVLDRQTCGWHYVEGLTLRDDWRIAILWNEDSSDRVASGTQNAHLVVYLQDPSVHVVAARDWQRFLDEQQALLKLRTQAARDGVPLLSAQVRLPDGRLVKEYDAPFRIDEIRADGGGYLSGESIGRNDLRWWHAGDGALPSNGTVSFALTLGETHFKPVKVTISDGKPTPDRFVFEPATEADAERRSN
jgi:hypothetical protein